MVPLHAAVGLCDLFYALMAFPTMITLILLRKDVKAESRRFFARKKTETNKNAENGKTFATD